MVMPMRGTRTFLVLLLLLRGIFLLAALDPEEERIQAAFDPSGAEWSHGPGRPLYDREELYTGTAAEAMRLGLPLPLSAYRFMAYGSGSLVVSLLARPVYALCGPTYLAFKLIPLLVSLLGGLCWFLVVRAWRGPRAAFAFGLLYALAPPVLVRTALIAKGDHAEAMAITGAVLLLATQAAFAAARPRRCAFAAAAGVVAGLGVYFTYSTVPVTGAMALVALVRARARPRDAWLAALAGLALGLLPWFLTVTLTQGEALRVYNRPLGALVDPGEIVRRIQLLLATGFFAGYDLPGGFVVRRLAAWVWMAAVLLGWMLLLRDRRAPGRWLILAGTAAHLAAFLLSAPDASSRYLVPAYPLLLLAVILPWSNAPDRSRTVPGVVASAVMGLGLFSMLAVTASSSFPSLRAPLKGYDWPLLGEVLGAKLTPEGVRAAPAQTRPFLWVGVGRRLARTVPPSDWGTEIESTLAEGTKPPGPASHHATAMWTWAGIGMSLVEAGRVDEIPELAHGMVMPDYLRLLDGAFRYPEMVFAPILQARGLPGIEQFLSRLKERWWQVVNDSGKPYDTRTRQWLEKMWQQRVEDKWARHRAMLLVHGVSVSAEPVSDIEDAAAVLQRGVAAVPRDVAERALGWALYRGQRLDGTPRFWAAPERMHTAANDGFLVSSKAFWEGVASAFRDDLVLRSSSRFLARESAPGNAESVAESDVRRFVRGVPPEMAGLFNTHAGSMEADGDPSRPSGYDVPESMKILNEAPTGSSPADEEESQP
jgi:hypothetical protein